MIAISKKQILQYLEELSMELGRRNLKGEILLFGGAAMVLLFNARSATKDVDAIFRPKREIYAISREIGDRHNLPEGWLNDSIKGFIGSDSFQQNLFIKFVDLRVIDPQTAVFEINVGGGQVVCDESENNLVLIKNRLFLAGVKVNFPVRPRNLDINIVRVKFFKGYSVKDIDKIGAA